VSPRRKKRGGGQTRGERRREEGRRSSLSASKSGRKSLRKTPGLIKRNEDESSLRFTLHRGVSRDKYLGSSKGNSERSQRRKEDEEKGGPGTLETPS